MIQEEKIQSFIKNQTTNWLKEDIVQIEQQFPQRREEIVQSLATVLDRIFQHAYDLQQNKEKGAIAYLYISLLRTNLLTDHYAYRIDLYNEKLYLDKIECTDTWQFDFIWEFLTQRIVQLKQTIYSSIYANKVRTYHLNEIKLVMAEGYQRIAILLTKVFIAEAIQKTEFSKFSKTDSFTICMGDYQSSNLLLYKMQ